jgi:3-oxoacyl-[acyl-carrier-protein] synthase II
MRVVEAPSAPRSNTPSAAPRVAIRGWSLVTPLGDDLAAQWRLLLGGAFITDHASCGRRAVDLAQSVVASLGQDRLDPEAGFVVGTSKGSVENWLEASGDWARRRAGLADIAAAVAAACQVTGPRLTVSAACASGLHALIRGAMMIQSGEARQVLVVATEASVHPLFLGSFRRLGVLAKPGLGCRPFDRSRDGFLMSEAAAAVLLQGCEGHTDDVLTEGPSILLDRFALAADATHLTGGDPGACALRYVLNRVIDDRPVDLVHAHGTGTSLNDEVELAAIEAAVPGDQAPPVLYSHKGALGHSLGAAGLVSVVLNCQSHATGVVPPNVQTRDPLPTRKVLLSSEPVHREVRRSVALAAGFGGAIAAVSIVSNPPVFR